MNKYKVSNKERAMSTPRADNIINLRPNNINPSNIRDIEDAINLAKQIREDLADDITEIAMEQFVGWLANYGIFTESEKFNVKDIMMIENAMASALYRYYGLEHPLQQMTDESILFQEEDECDRGEDQSS